jgi:hypothetical protein
MRQDRPFRLPRFSLEVITGRLLGGQFHLSNDVSALGDSLG